MKGLRNISVVLLIISLFLNEKIASENNYPYYINSIVSQQSSSNDEGLFWIIKKKLYEEIANTVRSFAKKNNLDYLTFTDLPKYFQDKLTEKFDSRILDCLKIYNKIPYDDLSTSVGKEFEILHQFGGLDPQDIGAITLGCEVYFNKLFPFDPKNLTTRYNNKFDPEVTLVHELVHVYQYHKYGWDGFVKKYTEEALSTGYYEVSMEKEAYTFANSWRSWKNGRAALSPRDFFFKDFVILILDSSGSMESNDPYNIRQKATEQLIRQIYDIDNVYIIDFDNTARLIGESSNILGDRDDLIKAVSRIDNDGQTNLYDALQLAKNQILKNNLKGSNGAVLLFTDGKANVGKLNFNDITYWFSQNEVPIYTISYKNLADFNLLQQIAALSKGTYLQANSASEVAAAFQIFINQITEKSLITIISEFIAQGESKLISFFVDQLSNKLLASLSWPGSDIGLELTDPNGNIHNKYSLAPQWEKGSNYSIVQINNPIPGKWSATLKGLDIPSDKEPFTFQVSTDSPNKIDVNIKLVDAGYAEINLIDKNSILNLSSLSPSISLITPNGTNNDISDKYNNGKLEVLPSSGEGNYKVNFEINEKSKTGEIIQRQFTRTIYFGEGTIPFISTINDFMGTLLISDIGSERGNRKGYTCTIIDPKTNTVKADGFIIGIDKRECIVKVRTVYSDNSISKGDILKLDPLQWSQD